MTKISLSQTGQLSLYIPYSELGSAYYPSWDYYEFRLQDATLDYATDTTDENYESIYGLTFNASPFDSEGIMVSGNVDIPQNAISMSAIVTIDAIRQSNNATQSFTYYSDIVYLDSGEDSGDGDSSDPNLQPSGEFEFYLNGSNLYLRGGFDYGDNWGPAEININKNGDYFRYISLDDYKSFGNNDDVFVCKYTDGDFYEATLQFDYNGFGQYEPITFSTTYPPEEDDDYISPYVDLWVSFEEGRYILRGSADNGSHSVDLTVSDALCGNEDNASEETFGDYSGGSLFNFAQDLESSEGIDLTDTLKQVGYGNCYITVILNDNDPTTNPSPDGTSEWTFWLEFDAEYVVASYDDAMYGTLEEAIEAANAGDGGTIKLLADCDYGELTSDYFVMFSKDVTIDGQGKYEITASIAADFYRVAASTTLTLQNLTMTVTTSSGSNMGVIYLGTVNSAKVYIDNCTIRSTNDVALQASKRSGGGYYITNSTIYGGRCAVRYNNSDHMLDIKNSEIDGGSYSILMCGSDPRAEITITDSIVSDGIYLQTGRAKATLAGDTVVKSSVSGFCVCVGTANNALTVTDNVQIKGKIEVKAGGTVNFDNNYSGMPVILHSGTDYYLHDTLLTAVADANSDSTITLYADLDLNKTDGTTDSTIFKLININKNLTIDGRGRHKIIGEHADKENPQNQFQSMFYVKSSDITFTLKNIEIDYTSYTSNNYQGVIIYNANVNATINVENSTLVGSKGIYSNNADSIINILGSTIIGKKSAAIILSSVLSNTRSQKVTIDSSFVSATGSLGCITIADSNTNLVIKGNSIIDPNINNYDGYKELNPTAMAIYIAAGLNNEAEYYPTITIYGKSRVYNGPKRSNGKYYGAIYCNGDNFTRPINVKFGNNYEGPAFICNALELTSGQKSYGYFYDEKSPLFNSFSTLVPDGDDGFGDDIYVLLANDTNINNTIALTKNLHFQKATIVDANGNIVEKELLITSSVDSTFKPVNDTINITIAGIKVIIDNFANIAYKTGILTIYQYLEVALEKGYRVYALSDNIKTEAAEAGYTFEAANNNGYYEVIRELIDYFNDDDLNKLWNQLVNTTNYITQSKNGYGIQQIHDALIKYTKLIHDHEPSKIADYMTGIAVCARYLAGKENYINGADDLNQIVENLQTEPQ